MTLYSDYITLSLQKPNIEIFLKKCSRAKRLSIKIRDKTNIKLIIPKNTHMQTALSFLYRNELWIRSKIKEFPEKIPFPFKFSGTVFILGSPVTITYTDKNIIFPFIENNKLYISCNDSIVNKIVLRFLYSMAEEKITQYANINAKKLNVSFNKITIKDTSSILGSCSSKKNLSFNWRLIMMPENILRYVTIHEVCHLKEMNHSPDFWSNVEKLDENFQEHRKWIKKNISRFYSFKT